MNGRADLHVHTTASDGQYTPEQVVEMARGLGLRAIAITDHETTLGVEPAKAAAQGSNIEVVPGVEISVESTQGEVHILGYFIEVEGSDLEKGLQMLRVARLDRARRMVKKLASLGVPVDWERVRELAAGESVGRPHIARAMVERGHVATIDEAFALYIGSRGPAYVERKRVTPADAITMIRQARGVAAMAHPLRVAAIVPALVKAGLQGLEVYYPGYTAEEIRYLEEIARRYRLVRTGGSDFHGADVMAVELGASTTSYIAVEKLRARRPQAAPSPHEAEPVRPAP